MATDTDRKPVLLTVDDDPGVSRAVARDLRRQYGEAYRVVRTESGPQALETLRELKLRGDPVAVLLADHRMPDMSGLEFLEEAMDLFPHARRALLTAYADTDAAIEAINVVDLDHRRLRHRDRRRRTGGPRRGGVRGVRGSAHRAGRAPGHGRASGPERADRELSRVPRRRHGCAAHRPGAAAGSQVRRRGPHH